METTRNPTGELSEIQSVIANPIPMALQTQVRKRVVWNDSKDISLLKEMIVTNPFSYKERTRERGKMWQSVASNLNAMWETDKTDSRGYRELYNLLKTKHVKELVNLEKESETSSLPSGNIKKEKEDEQEMRNRCLNAMTPIKGQRVKMCKTRKEGSRMRPCSRKNGERVKVEK
ncbi:uncharacterized protein LOC117125298 [Anneissia japonica]|uniref:uncharacterized protein LOC117125298 n=1 Tax=Anneissia japonica TaxID=1529436 RepID=UPI00142566C5|nr:uncharacterized protein LOC117125298 [Anneissia japonica]